MSVDIIEVQSGTIAASGSQIVTPATTLVPNDVVVFLTFKTGTGGTATISQEAGFVSGLANGVARDLIIHYGRGYTGSISPQVNIGTSSGDWWMFVLRSTLSNPVFYLNGGFAADTSVSPALTDLGSTQDVYAPNGAAVIGITWMAGGTLTRTKSPSSGWTDETAPSTATAQITYQELTANSLVSLKIKSSSNLQSGVTGQAVFFDEPMTMLRTMALEVVVSNATPPVAYKGWGLPMR